jgi:hypothetical protein
MRSEPGVFEHHASISTDPNGLEADEPVNEKTPSEEGVFSFPVTDFQEESVDVSSGGGGNCTRDAISAKSIAA